MQVYMVLDPDNLHNVIGYYTDGTIYDNPANIPRSTNWRGQREAVSISADTAYIEGQGIVNLADMRARELARLRLQRELDVTRLDPVTRALYNWYDDTQP